MQKDKIIYSPLFWITLSLPVVLWSVVFIYPTFDDWTSTPSPNPDAFSWDLLLPRKSYWRPFESLYGWCLAHYRWLMPWLSHVIVIAGHYIGAIMVYFVALQLGFKLMARNMATILFWLSTGAIATTTACDGMSQTWVHTLGMVALYSYLKHARQASSSFVWLLIIAFATFVKENAVCWGVAIPLIGYVFGFVNKQKALKDIFIAFFWGILYSLIHFAMPTAADYRLEADYFDFSIMRMLRGVAMWVAFSWLPVDYIHLLHAPHRNLLYVGLSVLAISPFLICLLKSAHISVRSRSFWGLLCAAVILVAPHIMTIFSMMHVYASLGIVALMAGYMVNNMCKQKYLLTAFGLYFLTSVTVNVQHCVAAYDSGELGRRLAAEAVEGVEKPVDRAFLLLIDNGEQRYSNFFVLPWETFGWGGGIQWQTSHKWPREIGDTLIPGGDEIMIQTLSDSLLHKANYDCVWIVKDSHIITHTK